MVELSKLSRTEIATLLRELGVNGDVHRTAAVDLDGKGGLDLAVIVSPSTGQRRRDEQTFFVIDDGAQVRSQKYSEGYAFNSSSLDDRRFANLYERTRPLFPYGQPAYRTLNQHDTIGAAPEPTWSDRFSSAYGAVKNFFVPNPKEEDLIVAQVSALREIRGTKDPRFFDLLMDIAANDVHLRRCLIYDPKVLALADEIATDLIPNLNIHQLIEFESTTRQRLSDVKAFWAEKSRTGQEEGSVDRIKSLLSRARAGLAQRARSTETRVVSTEYISTHYAETTGAIVGSPVRLLAGMKDMIERSNPVNLLPRMAVGGFMFAWEALGGADGIVPGFVTAGAFGHYGAELGRRIGDISVAVVGAVSLVKAVPSVESTKTPMKDVVREPSPVRRVGDIPLGKNVPLEPRDVVRKLGTLTRRLDPKNSGDFPRRVVVIREDGTRITTQLTDIFSDGGSQAGTFYFSDPVRRGSSDVNPCCLFLEEITSITFLE